MLPKTCPAPGPRVSSAGSTRQRSSSARGCPSSADAAACRFSADGASSYLPLQHNTRRCETHSGEGSLQVAVCTTRWSAGTPHRLAGQRRPRTTATPEPRRRPRLHLVRRTHERRPESWAAALPGRASPSPGTTPAGRSASGGRARRSPLAARSRGSSACTRSAAAGREARMPPARPAALRRCHPPRPRPRAGQRTAAGLPLSPRRPAQPVQGRGPQPTLLESPHPRSPARNHTRVTRALVRRSRGLWTHLTRGLRKDGQPLV